MATIATTRVAPQRRVRGLPVLVNALVNAKTLLGAGAFYAFFIALIVGFLYPSISQINIGAYLGSSAVSGLVGTGGVKITNFSTFSTLIAIELYGAFYGLIFGSIVAYIAGSALPLTIENGTLDLALARPFSRTRYYLELWGAALIASVVLCLLTLLSIWVCTLFVKDANINWQWLTVTQLIEMAFLVFSVGLGMLFGSFLNASRAAGGAAVGIIFLAYFMNTFGSLSNNFNWLLRIEPFYYAPGIQAFLTHDFTQWHPWVLIGVGLLCGLAGLAIFNRRDLPTT